MYALRKTEFYEDPHSGAPIIGNTIGNLVAGGIASRNTSQVRNPKDPNVGDFPGQRGPQLAANSKDSSFLGSLFNGAKTLYNDAKADVIKLEDKAASYYQSLVNDGTSLKSFVEQKLDRIIASANSELDTITVTASRRIDQTQNAITQGIATAIGDFRRAEQATARGVNRAFTAIGQAQINQANAQVAAGQTIVSGIRSFAATPVGQPFAFYANPQFSIFDYPPPNPQQYITRAQLTVGSVTAGAVEAGSYALPLLKGTGSVANAGLDAAESEVLATSKFVPNPYGKLGGPAHQAVVGDLRASIESRGLLSVTEFFLRTPNGAKGSRFVDVVGIDRATGLPVEYYQVGKQTLAGNPISREAQAIRDIQQVTNQPVTFKPYNHIGN